MTEAEWFACTEPGPMLEFLRGRASDRKLRLLACACWRWEKLPVFLPIDELRRIESAVEVAERYADTRASREDLLPLRPLALGVACGRGWTAAERALQEIRWRPWIVPAMPLDRRERDWTPAERLVVARAQEEMQSNLGKYLVSLFHDVFGYPLRVEKLEPTWLTWNEGCVKRLAQAIYEARRFEDLPVLADALEEAGCDNPRILGHCRGGGGHVRGCWVVDLLTNKA